MDVSQDLQALVRPFGVSPKQLIDFSQQPRPETLPYIGLFDSSRENPALAGVVEIDRQPIACLINASSEPHGLPSLRRKVAFRGDIPYLAVVEPGRMTVYDVALDVADPLLPVIERTVGSTGALFYDLYLEPRNKPLPGQRLHDLIFDLFDDAIAGLQRVGVDREDALSLAGRALFVRFLMDRGELGSQGDDVFGAGVDPKDSFRDANRVADTCRRLDRTFNGDFLPLSREAVTLEFTHLSSGAFFHLSNIVRKSRGGQLLFDWGDLDFGHIPVGLLSEIYERMSRRWDPKGQRRESRYFTPWRIARYMAAEVFEAIEAEGGETHHLRVLDPAVGGGVFLVAAFQELVASFWRYYGIPPGTKQIRHILNEQLMGFDISEPGLRLTALALYLKAIELDFGPRSGESLRFEPLRGKVLRDLSRSRSSDGSSLGSLGPDAGEEHICAYDVVLGNPPWTAYDKKHKKTHCEIVDLLRPFVRDRLGEEREREFQIPDRLPDIAFAWNAMKWARPGGWIALALHARLLFKTSVVGVRARTDLFNALTVRGILNGTALRKTPVWENTDAPFCLFFAQNRLPQDGQSFWYASPYLEESINRQGRLRIDAKAAVPVSLRRLKEEPFLLKLLFKGNAMDAVVFHKLGEREWPTLNGFWGKWNLAHGQGFKVGRNPSMDAGFLGGLPMLRSRNWGGRPAIDTGSLPRFNLTRVERRRSERIYRPPLLLVKKSITPEAQSLSSLVVANKLAYSESYHGYSVYGHPNSGLLVRFLALLFRSRLPLWYALVSGGSFGVERDVLESRDYGDGLSIPDPIEDFVSGAEIADLFRALEHGREDRDALDEYLCGLYGLDRWDIETIRDTLTVELPFARAAQRAQQPPNDAEVRDFGERLLRELMPFVSQSGGEVRHLHDRQDPWEVFQFTSGQSEPRIRRVAELVAAVGDDSVSQVVFPSKNSLSIALLRQYRFWTPTRARLLALEILHEHFHALVGR